MKNNIILLGSIFLIIALSSGCYDVQPITNPLIIPPTTTGISTKTISPTSSPFPSPTTPSIEDEMSEWIDKTVVNINTRSNLISSFSELIDEVIETPVIALFPDTYDRFDEILSSLILESKIINEAKCPDEDIQSNNEEIFKETILFKENFLVSLKTWDQNAMSESLSQMKKIVDRINNTNQLLSQRYNK